jgi:hypothetical protein
VAAVADPQQQLDWEARLRPRVAIAAAFAGLAILGAEVWTTIVFRGGPDAPGFLESLERAARPGPIGELETLRLEAYGYYVDHSAQIIGSSVVRALGYLALGLVLVFLATAIRPRNPDYRRYSGIAAMIGSVLAAVALVAYAAGSVNALNDVVDGSRTVDAARDISGNSLLLTAELLGVSPQSSIAQFLLGLGLLFVCLNAMRVGLLTKFLGYLGIIAGVLIVIPLGPLPVVLGFWLFAFAALLVGRGPSGLPPSWRSGKAEPWPSQQEMVEERRRRAEARRGGPPPEPEPEPATVPAGRPHPASKKRKRKRRG